MLKQAADKRAELRRRAEGQPRPILPESMTPEMRARFDSVRFEFEVLARFDALPRPMVSRRMQRGP